MLAAWLPEEPGSPHGVMHDFPQFLDGPDRPIPRSARRAARARGDYARRIARTATRPPCLRWGQLPASATASAESRAATMKNPVGRPAGAAAAPGPAAAPPRARAPP